MPNAVRMLSNSDAVAEFDRDEKTDSSTIFNTKASLILPYTTVDNDGLEVTYEVGQEIMVNVACGVAKVGDNHIRVKRSDYTLSHLN